MQVHDVQQGSEDWHALRLARITASRFKDIMTDPRSKADKDAGALSDTARSYMMELLGEALTGVRPGFSNAATEWGIDNEPFAIAEYESHAGVVVEQVGIVSHGRVSGSPDGLIAHDGGIEVKCPFNPRIHDETLLDGMPKGHIPQVQGYMWLAERDWWDFVSFDPRIDGHKRLYVQRIERDDAYIKRLAGKVDAFREQLEAALFRLEAL